MEDNFTRPQRLTAEIVIKRFEPMIRNSIRKFKIENQSENELFQAIIAAMIAPSRRFGNSFLDRYDPSIAYASTYITTMVLNFLKGAYRTDKREDRLFQRFAINPLTGLKEPVRIESVIEADEVYAEVDQALAKDELLKILRSRRNKEFCSRNSRGKPRTTFRAAALMLLKGKSVAQIAEEFEVSQVEVRRRFGLLANDSLLRRIAEDYGWDFTTRKLG